MRNRIIYYANVKNSERVSDLYALIKIILLAFIALLFFAAGQLRASDGINTAVEPRYEFTGLVLDASSGDPVFGAAVLISGTNRGATCTFCAGTSFFYFKEYFSHTTIKNPTKELFCKPFDLSRILIFRQTE